MEIFLQLFFRSLETGSVYALAALGLIIIFRTSSVIHYAQGTMGMFSTFVVAVAAASLPLGISVLLGVGVAVILGVLVDVLVIRRAKRLDPIGVQIITLGLLMVFLGIAPAFFGVDPLPMPKFIASGELKIGTAAISYNGLFNIALSLVIMLALFFTLQKTKLGLAIRMTAENSTTARMMGVPVRNVTMFAWAIGGVLGCLSGVMVAPTTSVQLTLMDSVITAALISCLFGGVQSFIGPVVAAYILGIARNFMMFYVSTAWGEQIFYIFILLFIVVRPNGLIGKKVVKKV